MIEESFLAPLSTNMAFLYECLDCEPFRSANLDTGLIERLGEDLLGGEVSEALAGEGLDQLLSYSAIDLDYAERDLIEGLSGLRLNSPPRETAHVYLGKEPREVRLDARDGFETFSVLPIDQGAVLVNERGNMSRLSLAPEGGHSGAASAADGAILAPMPGEVIALDVADGDNVTEGQRLMVLEAMKMEHALTAPFDGTISCLEASEGGQVQVEAVLCVVEPIEA